METKTITELQDYIDGLSFEDYSNKKNIERWVRVDDEIGFNELLLREISIYEPTQLTLSLANIIVKHINELSQSNPSGDKFE